MLVNNECSSRYNRVGNILMSVWDRRKGMYIAMDWYARLVEPALLWSVRSMALHVMAGKY